MSSNQLLIGCHVSTRGGYGRAARRAWEIGARSFQYFPKNPRSMSIKTLDASAAADCLTFCREHGMPSIAHTPYPINIAIGDSRGRELYELTVKSLQNDLIIAEACGTVGIVVHFGHFKGRDALQGYKNIIQCLNETLSGWQGSAKILLENQAGTPGSMGITLDELVNIRRLSDYPEKIGFCLDTCHAYASGVWDPRTTDALVERGRELGYWSDLAAVHLNDSKYPLGSGKDRHERIGQGYIGEEAFQALLSYPEFHGKALVLETDAGEDGTHRGDIAKVKSWPID
ncbi:MULTISPECIES: deoxyribonuclease IV [Paenibacillus]|uniref:deoxyribonuclease IV n=1 Tax=Paenibacillus TaxID=44249 RepID=UPI000E286F7A|nr:MULTISPECIES: deoxyribonuclease IV [Paenibacillus]MBJ9988725.1 deoxyribonuclease IV [Paenibacillus sp. S28]MCM2999099.1 deoxyribonuclease IV [Paenibacillus cellulositrophicus]RED39704.1 endonuclease IV [Paenibacillus sp. VMFN-D1]